MEFQQGVIFMCFYISELQRRENKVSMFLKERRPVWIVWVMRVRENSVTNKISLEQVPVGDTSTACWKKKKREKQVAPHFYSC